MTMVKAETSVVTDVTLDDVTQRFDTGKRQVTALEDVTLAAPGGKITAIVGPSGCGKSTLLDIVAGLVAPTSGSVRHGDHVVAGAADRVAMAFQQPALMPWLEVRDNIALGLRGRGVRRREARDRVAGLIELMGLDSFERAYPHELSGGMAQRVGIARALAMQPAILLLDEPFASVDAYTRVRLQDELLRIMQERPVTVLFVTHDVGEAVYLGDRLVVMSARPGRVVRSVDLERAARDRSSAYHAQTVSSVLETLFERS